MPAKQLASLTKPSSDSIYEMLCLLSNEPTLFKVEAHSIYPCLAVFLFCIWFYWKEHIHSMKKPMVWHSQLGNLREQHLINRLVFKEHSHIMCTKKEEIQRSWKLFQILLQFPNPLGTYFGEKLSSLERCASRARATHFKPLLKGGSDLLICKEVFR